MKARTHNRRKTTTDHYFELVKAFPLKPIRSEAEYDRAVETVNKLAVREEGTLDAGEQDYMEALAIIIQAYDAEHHAINANVTPLATLKFLMAEHDMNISDLGRVIGSQPAASMIFNAKRQISREQARLLAAHFGVSHAMFL